MITTQFALWHRYGLILMIKPLGFQVLFGRKILTCIRTRHLSISAQRVLNSRFVSQMKNDPKVKGIEP